MNVETIKIGYDGLSLPELAAVARDGRKVVLTEGSEARIRKTRRLVERWITEGRTIYGITTGFGALSDVTISAINTRRLQENIIMSHSAGVGAPLSPETVRAVLVLRIKDLARGHSGIRLETVQRLIELLNLNICPVIPEKGSVGASGDLAPLAHLALVLLGKGEAFCKGKQNAGCRGP